MLRTGLCILLFSLGAGAAHADASACGDSGDPQALADEGLRLYKAAFRLQDAALRGKEFERSLRCFQAAQRLKPVPKLYHPFGLVYEKLERNAEAATAFERFLALVPEAERNVGVTRQIDDKLAVLRKKVGALDIDTAPGIEVRVDQVLEGRAPLRRVVYVEPGAHVVSAGDPGVGTLGTEVRVEGGEARRVDLTAWRPRPALAAATTTPTTTKTAPAPATPPIYRRWWLWGIVGGLVAVGVGVGLGVGLTQSGGAGEPVFPKVMF